MKSLFRILAQNTSHAVATPWAFVGALLVVLCWALSGPAFGFSDTWQLVINTGTTIVTFLMVFLIQNSQNRDAKAIQLKLDELIRGAEGPRTALVGLEGMTDEQLDMLQAQFEKIRHHNENRVPDITETVRPDLSDSDTPAQTSSHVGRGA